MYGLIVGDAMGVPYEFKMRGSFHCDGTMSHGGVHGKSAGIWSDDTSMALAILDSLNHRGRIDEDDIMRRFTNWVSFGAYTADGDVFDMGITCAEAIRKYNSGTKATLCGNKHERANGNGALMRCLPVAVFAKLNGLGAEPVERVAALTHAHPLNLECNDMFFECVGGIIDGKTKEAACADAWKKYPHVCREPAMLTQSEVVSSGYVVDSLESAICSFLTTKSYTDCITKAINLGGDTDTVAAIAGGIAGLYYGTPEALISQIKNIDYARTIIEHENSVFMRVKKC